MNGRARSAPLKPSISIMVPKSQPSGAACCQRLSGPDNSICQIAPSLQARLSQQQQQQQCNARETQDCSLDEESRLAALEARSSRCTIIGAGFGFGAASCAICGAETQCSAVSKRKGRLLGQSARHFEAARQLSSLRTQRQRRARRTRRFCAGPLN